jgi:hypothetical protein
MMKSLNEIPPALALMPQRGVKPWLIAGLVALGSELALPAQPTPAAQPLNIGSRLELFVDRLLVAEMKNVAFRLHHPVKAPPSAAPFPGGFYATIIKDGDTFKAWYRGRDPDYDGPTFNGHPGECLHYAESADGVNWTLPNFGRYVVGGTRENNVILRDLPPFVHNLCPFLDHRPGVPASERFKAVAGCASMPEDKEKGLPKRSLYAFVSADGIDWEQRGEIIPFQSEWRHAFDSSNLAFWSEAEGIYVCYFRTWTKAGNLRSVSRATSPDFVTWSDPVALDPNLPGEHLYTLNTHPYVRAPHLYIALPTRFVTQRGSAPGYNKRESNSTDILFMSKRAGASHYDRLFTEALIRPGRDPELWGNRANYAAQNVVLTAPDELSIYHKNGDRYTLRPDGFISVRAGSTAGELVTQPLIFEGQELVLNFSTSAAGSIAVELLDAEGKPLPGYHQADAQPEYGDHIEHVMTWKSGDLSALAGKPVRLRFSMLECDLFSFRFRNTPR